MKRFSPKLKLRLFTVAACLIVACAVAAEPPKASAPPQGKTFIFHNSIRDLTEFRAYAEIAARLKAYGTVAIDIGVLAEKSPTHLPGIRSPWHDYGAYMATMWAFFPHPTLAPHLSSNWVAKNRALLLGKVAILKELGLGAVFSANETQFLPESFFRKHPHLRGPRVDAPARSKRAEFAWCVDQPATLEMIEWMMAELKRHAPQIQEIHSWTGDSGSGLCWLHLYPGRNGPTYCRAIDPGVRVRKLIEAMDRGARTGGGPVHIRLAGNFQEPDREKIEPLLPSSAKFGATFVRASDNSLVVVATRLSEAYPIRGIIDLFAVLDALNNVADPSVRTVDIDTGQSWYYRTDEPLATVRRLVAIVEDTMKHPAPGQEDATPKARALAVVWAGEKNADRVVQAFKLVSQSFGPFSRGRSIAFRNDVILGKGYAFTATNRLMTRPLLIKPELLTREEEGYFLPYIFSAEEDDARLDYNTAHSDRRTGLTEYHSLAFRNIHDSALEAAALFEQVADAPAGDWFRQLALSLRLWASTVRSHDNFYFAQEIRDRNAEGLAAPPRQMYSKLTRTPDLLLWNEIQRDELDNANDLRAMLEYGGLELVARARTTRDEDSFLYGPDLLAALQKKVDLMRAHWLDAQGYLIPLK